MRNLKKLLALLLALVMVVGIMAGCTGGEDTTPSDDDTQGTEDTQGTTDTTGAAVEDGPQYGGHLDVASAVKLNGLDPMKQTGVWKYMWTTCVYENPLTRDADNQIAPEVCDYEWSEEELTLKLWVVEGKVFHNGDPVDIYDVEASIVRALNLRPKMNSLVLPLVKEMTVDEASGVLTISFTEFSENILYYLAAYQTWCAVMPKEICEKYPEDYVTNEMADAIGTGPYQVTYFEDSVELTVSKFEDYVVQESDRTGFAGPKYGYLDSITFWTNADGSSRNMGLFAGDYDVIEFVANDYRSMMEESKIVESRYPSNSGLMMYLNSMGANNVFSKYPSLRKAAMAAIDYEPYLDTITDQQQVLAGCPVRDSAYQTDAFINADYYGAANQEAVDKYVAMAKEEGWNGTDPVVCVCSSARNDIITLAESYLKKAGIPIEVMQIESTALSEWMDDPASVWDMSFSFPTMTNTPTQLGTDILYNYWINEEKDAILDEMQTMKMGSEEYIAKWEELVDIWVNDVNCGPAYMGYIDWFWYHPEGLVTNDTETVQRYFYNAYWTDPSAHQD